MSQPPLPMEIFTSEDGSIRLQLKVVDDTLWLTQRQMADLFEKSPPTISEHLKNLYEEGELEPEATIRKFRTVAREGTRDVERLLDHYNLDAVLAVGYRVRSNRGMQFRQWATRVLKEYLIKGFAMDDERLKNPDRDLGADYFDELLTRIRDIRASSTNMRSCRMPDRYRRKWRSNWRRSSTRSTKPCAAKRWSIRKATSMPSSSRRCN